VLRHPADRFPVILILSLTALDFVMYFMVESVAVLAAYLLAMLIPKGCICAWNHHHQHTLTFVHTLPNRFLELSYGLHTGATTHLWLLHHVFGHHRNFLNQELDESRWRRRDGTRMDTLEYTLTVALTSYYRGFLVGRRYPDKYRTHVIFTLLAAAVVIGLTIAKPVAALMLFILPMITGLLITAWATYDHHAGLDTGDEFNASYNNMNRIFNLLTGNLGYHTAHHHKQGVHWSELPRLHDEIKDQIPNALFRASLWDLLTPAHLQGHA